MEEFNKSSLEQIYQEKKLKEWKKAGEPVWIDRRGWFYPRRKPRYDASINPVNDYYYSKKIGINEFLDSASTEYFGSTLKWYWDQILMNRQVQEAHGDVFNIPSNPYNNMLDYVAFAPTTQQLFREVIAPAIQKHCKEHKKNALAIGSVSYLIPLWERKALGPIEIVEGDLHKLIKNGGRLPDNIGAVYFDYPSNQVKKDSVFSLEELLKFIDNHPSVLFIIDQANLYYKTLGMNNVRDLMIKTHIGKLSYPYSDTFQRESSVIVTNTTSKSVGFSGCAVAVATNFAEHLIKKSRDPAVLVGFNEISAKKRALAASHLEIPQNYAGGFPRNIDDVPAFQFREKIRKNRELFVSTLEEMFPGATCQDILVVEGARIIIDSKKVGFPTANELSEFLYKYFDLGTKPAWVYASKDVREEWDQYLQITVPWNDKMLKAFSDAFAKLKEEYDR